MNPASSRAMAVTTILRLVLRSSRRRNRPQSRTWAAQARATVTSGLRCSWRRRSSTPRLGRDLVRPGRLDELGAQVHIAGVGDMTAPDVLATGMLGRGEPGEGHERARGAKPTPVADLSGQTERAEFGDSPVGGETGDSIGERRPGVPHGSGRRRWRRRRPLGR